MAINPLGWSKTAGSNTTVGGVGIGEGMSPSGVNNAMRAIMAGVAELVDAIGGAVTSTGSSGTYALTSGYSLSAYAAGQLFIFEANHTNTGAATLNVDTIGAKDIIRSDGNALRPGDIVSGGFAICAYEAGADDFVLLNPTPGTGKHSIYVPAGAMVSATTNGAAAGQTEETTNAHNYATLAFDDGTDEYACFEILMPADWNEGTITFQAVWSSTAADTDGVTWGLQAVAVADGDDSDVAYGTAVTVDDANQSNAGDVLITAESGAVTVAGSPAANELTFFRVFRDVSAANDTATEDALLRGVRIYYNTDAPDET